LGWIFFEEGLEFRGTLATRVQAGEEVKVGFEGGSVVRGRFL